MQRPVGRSVENVRHCSFGRWRSVRPVEQGAWPAACRNCSQIGGERRCWSHDAALPSELTSSLTYGMLVDSEGVVGIFSETHKSRDASIFNQPLISPPTQGLARDSAATWRMRLKFDNAQSGENSNLGHAWSSTLLPIESAYATFY